MLLSHKQNCIEFVQPSDTSVAVRIQVFVCVVGVCCLCDFLLPPNVGLAVSGVTYGLWSLWLAIVEGRCVSLRCNPLVTYQLWQGMTLGFSPLYLAINYSSENPVPFTRTVVPIEQVAFGHAILVVGAFALYLGMKRFEPRERAPRSQRRREVSAWELATCFVASAAIQIFTPEITAAVGSTFIVLSNMGLAALSLFAIAPPSRFPRTRGVYWSVLLAGTVLMLLLYGRGDSKMMLSFSFVPLALAIQRRLGNLTLIAFGIGFTTLYLLVIAPLVGITRIKVQQDERGQRSVLDGSALVDVVTGMNANFRGDKTGYIGAWFDSTMLRLSDSVPVGFIHNSVANDGLRLGAGMEYVPLSFIPRMVWHEKPIIERGRYFTTILGMAAAENTATTSTGQTSAGELYWNFGWLGVISGMYLLGAVLAVWWRADRGDPTNGVLEMTAFISVTLSFVIGSGSAAGPTFITAISSALVLQMLITFRNWVFPR